MRSLVAAIAFGLIAAAFACASDNLLQGDGYAPDGTLPIAPASDRLDGGAGKCDGGSCDASILDGAVVMPIPDGATLPTNTCMTARAIGTLAGDTAGSPLGTTGTCSEWIRLRATEDNSGALGAPMKVKLTLTSTGHDFDLFVFFNPAKDVLSCTNPFAVSQTRGTVDEVLSLVWGEGTVANGSDDGRTIALQVQSAEGPCPAGSGWSLTADGNQ